MVSTLKKKQRSRRLLRPSDEFHQNVIIGNSIGDVKQSVEVEIGQIDIGLTSRRMLRQLIKTLLTLRS